MLWIVVDGGSRQRIVNDQDRWEWVNVSSGTGSPGQSWTKGCKMVVVAVYSINNTKEC